MNSKGNILICPLEWGLGHAARMIPLAGLLSDRGYKVFIGTGEEHFAIFREELPGINFINFPGFRTGYSRFLPQYLHMLAKLPSLLYHSVKEHYDLKQIILDNKIDVVISDNRFGLWNNDITSVYVTHMPRIPFPRLFRLMEFTGILLHRWVIKRYSLCFIPDLPGSDNLSGRLSHNIKLPGNVRYTGILSRFSLAGGSGELSKPGLNTVILSGPEPQRTMLRDKLASVARDRKGKYIFLEGKPGLSSQGKKESDNLVFYNHLAAENMKKLLKESSIIICRSGYSSLMDLVALNRSALVIPTPGQTEQEYLAGYLSAKGWFSTISQGKLNKDTPLQPLKSVFPGDIITQSTALLGNALDELSDYHHKKKQSRKTGSQA